MWAWAYRRGVKPCQIEPEKPDQSVYIPGRFGRSLRESRPPRRSVQAGAATAICGGRRELGHAQPPPIPSFSPRTPHQCDKNGKFRPRDKPVFFLPRANTIHQRPESPAFPCQPCNLAVAQHQAASAGAASSFARRLPTWPRKPFRAASLSVRRHGWPSYFTFDFSRSC